MRQDRRSRRQGFAPKGKSSDWHDTGVFSGNGRPKVVGVSEQVALSTRTMQRDAAKALRAWKRTLPKGVRV